MWWEHLGTQFELLLLQITTQRNWVSMQLSQAYSESLPKLNREVCKLCFWMHVPWSLFGVHIPLLQPSSQNEEAANQASFTILWTSYTWVHTFLFIGTKKMKIYHARVSVCPYRRWFCLLLLKPHQSYKLTTREGCSNPSVVFTCICWPNRTFKSHLKRL